MRTDGEGITISIVIPVYNEQQRIEAFLADVIAYVQSRSFAYEILIVDDGSTDATVAIVEAQLGRQVPGRYAILRLPCNRGKGGAVQAGMLQAKGDYIFFIDADGSTAISEIDTFMPCLGPHFDIYVAVRTIKHQAPLKRKFFGYGYIYLTNALLGMRLADFTCGFKCYRRDAARLIFSKQTLNNWSFDAEDLFIAHRHGCTIKEIPVYWTHKGGSKVRVWRNVIRCGVDLFRIRYNGLRKMYTF